MVACLPRPTFGRHSLAKVKSALEMGPLRCHPTLSAPGPSSLDSTLFPVRLQYHEGVPKKLSCISFYAPLFMCRSNMYIMITLARLANHQLLSFKEKCFQRGFYPIKMLLLLLGNTVIVVFPLSNEISNHYDLIECFVENDTDNLKIHLACSPMSTLFHTLGK